MSSAGGIQTVNRELACSVVRQYPNLMAVCAVTYATGPEREHARTHGVELLAGENEGDWLSVLLSRDLVALAQQPVLAVIGHGKFSGPAAAQLKTAMFPDSLLVHFVHTTPLDSEGLKEYRQEAYVQERERRIKEELQFAKQADLVVGIGPRIARYIRDHLAAYGKHDTLLELACGLSPDKANRIPPETPTILFVGRTESIGVKGLDILAFAAGHVTRACENSPVFRRPMPRFVVRGASARAEELERRLREMADHICPGTQIIVRPYTTDLSELKSDYLSSTVFLLPSREEGFGLVALEVLSFGLPIILSRESGIAEIVEHLSEEAFFDHGACIVSSHGQPEEAGRRFAEVIVRTLSDPNSIERFRHLRELLQPTCSWDSAARTFAESLHHRSNLTLTPPPQTRKASPSKVDWGDAPVAANLYGRHDDLQTLSGWFLPSIQGCRIISLFGMVGNGKTSLAVHLTRAVADKYASVVWRSLRNRPPLREVLRSLIATLSGQTVAGLSGRPEECASLLVEELRNRRCFIVLDNCDGMFQRNESEDDDTLRLANTVLDSVANSTHASCVLLTTPEKPLAVARLESVTNCVRSYQLRGLANDATPVLVGEKQLRATPDDWARLTDAYSGNPLALKLVSDQIRELFQGDVAAFLDQGPIVFESVRSLLDEHFADLSHLERHIMASLAIEREPSSVETLHHLSVHAYARSNVIESLEVLKRRCLIEVSRDGVNLQSFILEYVTDRLVELISKESLDGKVEWLNVVSIHRASSREYVRDAQQRVLVRPIAQKLTARSGPDDFAGQLRRVVAAVRGSSSRNPGYATSNALALGLDAGINFQGWDLSNVTIRQAYLQEARLPDVDLQGSDLSGTLFADTFGSVSAVAFFPDDRTFAAGSFVSFR